MVKELGGNRTDLCSKDLNVVLGEKVKMFESSLVIIESQIVNAIIPNVERKIKLSGARTPYLKLNMKIQKMSNSQLSRSQPGDFKYRPIQDSVGSLLKPYSRICMELLRSLNKTVKKKYNSVWKIETINGVEISRRFECLVSEKREHRTIMSTDFDSAYTNVSKDDLIRSVVNLARVVEWEMHLTKLLLKLISLLLDNNFVEIGDGIYKLGTQLAMGCSSSGDALDSVAI